MTDISIGCRRNASGPRLIPYLPEEEQIEMRGHTFST
jgi:hypothetical protein